MRRLAAALCFGTACLASAAGAVAMPNPEPAGANPSGVGSWAEPQIRLVVARGLMGGNLTTFRPDDTITRAEVSDLVAGLERRTVWAPQPSPEPPDASLPMPIAGLDGRLVRALGLSGAATRFLVAARDAGLTPPARFGTEATARLLRTADEPSRR